MEAHLVHVDAEGHLAAVAVLLQTGNANRFIGTIWQNIPEKQEKALEVPGVVLNVKDLLPADHGYYTFAGSLTTPPCSEGVTWFVLKHPVSLSASQLAEFARLYPRDARPIEPRNGREILETK
jgi:carbonic anhydrase